LPYDARRRPPGSVAATAPRHRGGPRLQARRV